jgi:hypothetical protein
LVVLCGLTTDSDRVEKKSLRRRAFLARVPR